MKTLNQLKYILINFLQSHAIVKEVRYCDKFDFNALTNKSYPAVNIDYAYSSNAKLTITHYYNVQIVDLIDDDVEGIEDEIYSDMQMIQEDFFTFLQYHKDFAFNPSVQVDKVIDDTVDRVAGVKFKIGLTVTRNLNLCASPTVS